MPNPTFYYLELVNSILADVIDNTYNAIYGLRCGNLILKGFSNHLNDMMRNYPENGSITNVLEVYLTIFAIYDIYRKDNESIPDDLDFPIMPRDWVIFELSYSRNINKWFITASNSKKEYNILVENADYFSALTEVAKKIFDWEVVQLKLDSEIAQSKIDWENLEKNDQSKLESNND